MTTRMPSAETQARLLASLRQRFQDTEPPPPPTAQAGETFQERMKRLIEESRVKTIEQADPEWREVLIDMAHKGVF